MVCIADEKKCGQSESATTLIKQTIDRADKSANLIHKEYKNKNELQINLVLITFKLLTMYALSTSS